MVFCTLCVYFSVWARVYIIWSWFQDDLNVIVVDWEKGADSMIYQQSAANTRVVGATIAQLLRTLVSNGPTSYDMFTLVGHSLGSHIAGYAGAYVNGTIARIFGGYT